MSDRPKGKSTVNMPPVRSGMFTPRLKLVRSAWLDCVANSTGWSRRVWRAEPKNVDSNFASSSSTVVCAIVGLISTTCRSRLFSSAAARTSVSDRSMVAGGSGRSKRSSMASVAASSIVTGSVRDWFARRTVSISCSSSSDGPMRSSSGANGPLQPAAAHATSSAASVSRSGTGWRGSYVLTRVAEPRWGRAGRP